MKYVYYRQLVNVAYTEKEMKGIYVLSLCALITFFTPFLHAFPMSVSFPLLTIDEIF